MEAKVIHAIGKRKTAIAKVWLKAGSGNVTVNNRKVEEYFGRKTSRMILRQPLILTNTQDKYDVVASVLGGGLSGQAYAIKHGITRALLIVNPDFRAVLKKAGFITRDSRAKERKKYGQPGARKRFQFSKR